MGRCQPSWVGHAFYASTDAERAEVAFAIADTHQGRRLGTILLGHLAEVAVGKGLRVFDAFVLDENHRMLEVFRESGFPVEVRAEPGELHVTLPTALTEEARERFERREQIAAANALLAFFNPGAVAVIGFRGGQRCDVEALEDALVRLGALADDLPQVVELDCNPIAGGEQGAVVVDARVRVAPSGPPPPLGARR